MASALGSCLICSSGGERVICFLFFLEVGYFTVDSDQFLYLIPSTVCSDNHHFGDPDGEGELFAKVSVWGEGYFFAIYQQFCLEVMVGYFASECVFAASDSL